MTRSGCLPGDNIYLTAILNILETFSTIGEAEGDVAIFVGFIFQLFHDELYDKYILYCSIEIIEG